LKLSNGEIREKKETKKEKENNHNKEINCNLRIIREEPLDVTDVSQKRMKTTKKF
jgi:hypothetical protein